MTYWDAMTIRGPICDEVAKMVLEDYGSINRLLADDDIQEPAGGVWKHIEDMASRRLVVIENDTARLT